MEKRGRKSWLIEIAVIALAVAVFFIFRGGEKGFDRVLTAEAAACPISDGGVGDDDGLTNGVVTISTSTAFTAITGTYDCTAVPFVITGTGTLTLAGNQATGQYAAVDFGTLTVNSGGKISADTQGCSNLQPYYGYNPNGSNVCVYQGQGYAGYGPGGNTSGAGGGHGGAGGLGVGTVEVGKFGDPYGSATAPVRFGASGGSANGQTGTGGTGGGVIRISVSGVFTHNGLLTANGGAGAVVSGGAAGGGGAGGSINVTATTMNGTTGTFSATGGIGADNTADGGGGGGGRVAVLAAGGSYVFDAGDFSVGGGSATGAAIAGAKGTVYVKNTAANAVTIFHGFTYDGTSHFASSWTVDPSATNQYCDITLGSGHAPAVHTTGAISFAGALTCATGNPGSGAYNVGTGTLSSSGTTVTGSGSNFQGQNINVGDAIIAGGQTRFVTFVASNTGLTVDGAFSPDLPASTPFVFSATGNSVSSLTFDAATGLTIANASSIKTKSAMFLSAGSTFTLGTGIVISTSKVNADIEFNVPTGNSQTWDSLTVNVGPEGEFITDDAFALTLQNGTQINSGVRWTKLASLTQNSGTTINANSRGCVNQQPYYGYVPDSNNNCVYNGQGYAGYGPGGNTSGAGGGHGGAGGLGVGTVEVGKFGDPNDSAVSPVRFGASGGSANGQPGSGGMGGGVIRINVTGTFTHNGTMTANGANGYVVGGGAAGGGGAGGSINLSAGTLNGTTGTFSATGGIGADNTADGGGGGGGRVAVLTGGGSYAFDAGDFAVSGGSASGLAIAGAKGTVYVKNTATNAVTLFHGFTYDNTNHFVSSWTVDPSATNQYCEITMGTGSIPAVRTTGPIALAGTLICATGNPGSGAYNVGTGTVSSSGTTVTGSSSNFQGQNIQVGDAIIAGGQTRFVTFVASNTSLTVDGAFSPDLPANTPFVFSSTANSISSITFDAATNLTIANNSSIKTKSALSLNAGSTFTVGTGIFLSTTKANADLEFNAPPGSQTWDSLTVNVGPEGEFITDDAFAVTLQNGTQINSNVRWTKLTSLTQNSGTTINANLKGCVNLQPYYGYVPDGNNNCVYNGQGYAGYGPGGNTAGAGGGHGGAGGLGVNTTETGKFGDPNDSAVSPVRFGASGGSANGQIGSGGMGGGLIRIGVTGTFVHNGTLTANGGNGFVVSGGAAGGGGAGGSINLTAGTLNGTTGTFSATGGIGADNTADGGGGGGGRVAVLTGGGSYAFDAGDFAVSGGSATGLAIAGAKGTVYVKNTATNAVTLFHGFTYDNTNHFVSSWTVDPSATNQYCDITMGPGSIPAVHTTGAISLNGTLICATGSPGSGAYTIGTGTLSSSGTTVTGSSSNFQGQNILVGDAIIAGGQTRFVTSVTSNTVLTVDGAFSPDLPSGTVFVYSVTANSISSLTFDAGTSLTIANGTSIKSKSALSFNAGTAFSLGTSVVISATRVNADVEFNVPTGSSQTWDSLTMKVGPEGEFITDDVFALILQNGTLINSNVRWTRLSSFTQDSGTSINASAKGCMNLQPYQGYVPNSANNCIYNDTGHAGYGASGNTGGGGGAHGGTGGIGTATTDHVGTPNDSATAPVLFGASGGSAGLAGTGGIGGGLIRISVSGTITHNGTLTANGGNGAVVTSGMAGGGGAGGSVYLTAPTYTCATGTFSAAGGNGADNTGDGGGGGGGRFSVEYGTDSSGGGCPLSGITAAAVVPGGTATGSAVAGGIGTINLTNPVPTPGTCPITDGGAGDDDGLANGTVTISSAKTFAAQAAVYDCTATPFSITATGTLTLNSTPASGTYAAVNFSALSIASGGLLQADGKGCLATTNYAMLPTGSNICSTTTETYGIGAGGGGHGGYGGVGTNQVGGIAYAYGSATNPVLYGGSGAGTNTGPTDGANGGGVIKISVTGTLTLDGTISANGNNGNPSGSSAGGGGAGGSVNITAGTINGTSGLIRARGGSGGDSTQDGGGGSGGRIAVVYNATGSSYAFSSSNLDVSGGTASGNAVAGAKGTVYVNDDNATKTTSIDDDITIYHGFTFADADTYVNSWTDDASATNQYCDLGMGGGATPSLSASTIARAGSLVCANGVIGLASGTISSSGTTVTGSGSNFWGQFGVGDLIFANGQIRFVTSITSTTSLTVDEAFSPNLSAGTAYRFTTASLSSLVFDATGTFSLANGTSIKTKGTMVLSAGTTFSMGTGVTVSVTKLNADLDLNIPAGSNQTWSGATLTAPPEGDFTVDDAVAITLSSGTVINANVRFTNLTAFTQDSGTTISANARGCFGSTNYGMMPTGSNNCTTTIDIYGLGAGGGSHGGLGGAGTLQQSVIGNPYDSATTPFLYGASGGGTNTGPIDSASGGGLVRINATGAVALNGAISANGANGKVNGSSATGGGAGGNVYVSTSGALSGSIATIFAKGGNGGDSTQDGGAGGGGRISLLFGSTSISLAAGLFDVSGGTATGNAIGGQKGTVYTADSAGTINSTGDDIVRIYHGYTFVDTDITVAQWQIDSSATNQYCDQNISGGTPSITTTSAITFDGMLNCTTSTSVGTGTLSSSGTTVTGSGTNFIGQLNIGNAIIAGGQTRFITSIASNTSLTVDSAFASAISGAIFAFNTASISSLTWSSASAFTYAAGSSSRVNGAVIVTAPTLTVGNAVLLVTRGTTILSASSSFSMGTGVSISDLATNTDIDFNIPSGNDQVWSGLTVNGPPEGDLTVDDAIAITLSSGTAINSSVRFTALTAFTQDNGTSINAGGKGCAGTTNYGMMPNGSNSCVTTIDIYGLGAGGGSHGGLGGAGTSQQGANGPTYGSATAPLLYGSSGGGLNTGPVNGTNGGGLVRINASGAIALNGTVSANGNNGQVFAPNAAGGGAGGSIYVSTTGALSGSITSIVAKGGGGGDSTQDGGGGGGGRISLVYGSTTLPLSASLFDVSGGTATGNAVAGQKGTVFVDQTGVNQFVFNDDDVRVYHGFTYTDFDWTVASWTVDPGAVQNCDPNMGTGATPSVTATGAISFAGTLNCTTVAPAGSGTISSSGTTVTGSGTNFIGQGIGIGTAIIAAGQTRFVTAVASNTSLTVDSAFSPALSGTIYTYNNQSISSFGWAAGTTFTYAANSAIRINGALFTSAPTLSVGNSSIVLSRGTMSLSATSGFSMGTGVAVSDLGTNTDIDFNIPAGNNQTWSGLTVITPLEGDFTVDDAVAITLASGTSITGNVRFTNLTAFTQDAGTSINANAKGCMGQSDYGMMPNGSNVCDTLVGIYGGGASGGGHGGLGGFGTSHAGAIPITYDSATAPSRYGMSGGGSGNNPVGAHGGGLVRIGATGAVALNGTISADGANSNSGASAGGGGAGGSVFVSTNGALSGSIALISAKGGNGADLGQDGGGGGGGRISLVYGSSPLSPAAAFFDVGGGTATGNAAPGQKGTVYLQNTNGNTPATTDDIVKIFHGFTFADVDHNVSQWIIDPSATNQYCDMGLGGGATPSVTATSAITFNGAFNCTTSMNMGTGTVSSSGTTVTGSGTNFLSQFAIGYPIVAAGQTRFVTAIASNTSMTVDSAFSPAVSVASFIYSTTSLAGFTWSSGAGFTSAAGTAIRINGALTMSAPSLSVGNSSILLSRGAISLSATTGFSVGTGVSITDLATNTDIDFNIPAGGSHTWSGLTVNTPQEGDFSVDDAVAITFASGTAINGNVRFTNLTAFTQDAGTSINANAKGCIGQSDYGNFPNGSNVCDTQIGIYGGGASGGGHGGLGGFGTSHAGGIPITYDSATAPSRYGASGGGSGNNPVGAHGGGLVRINASGSVTLNGTISANGANSNSGASAGGGGAGGSIFVTAGTLDGTPAAPYSAKGGNGADLGQDGGGGGGGRVAMIFSSATQALAAATFDVGGGSATGNAAAGQKGTVYVNESGVNKVTIFHGFTFADVDHNVSQWIIDPSATNQYCDMGLGGGATPSVTAASAITFNGALNCTTSMNMGTGTVSSSGTTVTGSGTNFTGQLAIGTPIVAAGQTRFVTAIASNTSMTVDSAFSPAVSAASFIFNNATLTSFAWSSATGFTTAASSVFRINGALTMSAPTLSVGNSAILLSKGAISLSATTGFSVGTGVNVTNFGTNTDIDFTIPAGADQTWDDLTVNGAREGDFIVDDSIAITLQNGTDINSNVRWTNLTNFAQLAGTSINANFKGCTGQPDYGLMPNGSNNCDTIIGTYGAGASGGGHGGAGGLGSSHAGGNPAAYDSASNPVLYGMSGGGSGNNPVGAHGGGLIRIATTGTVTHDGIISADGANGTIGSGGSAGGGGAGGSLNISATTYACATGTFSAKGGNGAVSTPKGGGGGGGRAAVNFTFDTSTGCPLAGLTVGGVVPGGTATASANPGANGSLSLTNINPVPVISTISPSAKNVGDAGFTMTVNGQYFIASSVVRLDGSDRATTFVNSTQLTATIPGSDLATDGVFTITVFNPGPGGGTSNGKTFTVSYAAPTVSTVTPDNGPQAGGTAVTISGTGFRQGSFGNGADGNVTVASGKNINTDVIAAGRSCADGVNFSVTALTANTATLSTSPGVGCISTGDEVLLINQQGTASNTVNVGNYETLRVQSVAGNVVTFAGNKIGSYGNGVSDDTNIGTASTNQRVMLQRIPNYADVTVNASTTLTASGWNGTKGGVLFFRSHGTVLNNGTISMTGNGYAGGFPNGASPGSDNCLLDGSSINGRAGESYGGQTTSPSCSVGTRVRNLGGGSGGAGYGGWFSPASVEGGSGGSYGAAGTPGTGDNATGQAGNTYGGPTLSDLFLGSGGGSAGGYTGGGHVGGIGGAGGGIVFIAATTLTNNSAIVSNGNRGFNANGDTGGNGAAGGGGSGGSIYIQTNAASLGSGAVTGTGGVTSPQSGQCSGLNRCGGNGGAGRVAVFYNSSVSGTTSPTATQAQRNLGDLTVTFGGTPATDVTFVNATTVTATTPARPAGPVDVVVTNPDGQSGTKTNGFTYAGLTPTPTTTSISPTSKTVGDAQFTMTVNGTNFVITSVVRLDGSDRATTYVSPTQLTATIPATDMATAGSFAITVFNPAPGGGTSNAQTFTVNNPVPTTTSISPTSRPANSGAFTLTVNGTNFVPTSVVRFAGADRSTSFVNATQLTASIPNGDIVTPGSFTITVFNPAPGGGTSNGQTFTVENPVPTTTSISPTHRDPGSAQFTMTVNGTNFIASSIVRFNGSDRATTFINGTQLTATIPASDQITPGTYTITVFNPAPGGGTSNGQTFIVGNPVPVTTSISPASKTLGDAAFTMTVNGSDFVPSSVVRFQGIDRTTTFVNDTQLTAAIPQSDMAVAGTFTITVFNPAPVGGTSNGQTFTVNNPLPTTTSISPSSKNVGDTTFTMTVNGTNFIAASVVRLNGSDRTTTFVNATQLTASIPTSDMTAAATRTITVFNPTPGGGTSNGQTFTINNLVPTTSSISPNSKNVGDGQFTMTVNGNNFVSGSIVRFEGSDRATTFIAATQITAVIPASDMTTQGFFNITVFNPAPGGGTSNPQTFFVGAASNPVPSTTSISPTSAPHNGPGFTMTVNGTNFIPPSVVRFAGSDRTTTYVSPTQITAFIPASDLTTLGSYSITVFNPAPGGGTSNAQIFTVQSTTPTTGNRVTMSRLKAGAVSTVDIAFTLTGTLSTPLTVTFPSGFTVLSAATGGSACLSNFGFTASTLTASKTNCTGPIIMTGATVQNPSTPGPYTISWVNDEPGSATVFITSDDQANVTASIEPTITFNVGSQAAATACDGTFSGNGGIVPFGVLTTSAVSTSDATGIPHICARLTTDASVGAAVAVRSLNAGLRSAATPADVIASSSATLAPAAEGYGLCAGSAGGDGGKTDPVGGPASAAPTRAAPFSGSCTASSHDVGGLTTSFQNVWSTSAPSLNAFMRLYLKASISTSTPSHNDYTDILTFIVTGTY